MAETNQHLKDTEVGEIFTGFVVVRRRELRTTRNGAPYLSLEFCDRSGRLNGNIWDEAEQLHKELQTGDVIKLQGRIEVFRDSRQVAVKRFRKATGEDNVDPADLIPSTDADTDELLTELKEIVGNLDDPNIRALLSEFLDDSQFAESFCAAPGGKLWHHNRLGGLIEHTSSVCKICRMLADHYPHLDRDLLLAGAILHDIGKVEEFRYGTFIDYTTRGRLVGHISLGAQWVVERASGIVGFPQDLLTRLQHMVLSHQDEFGSPVLPMFPEAFLLHYVDQIDSKLDALRRISADPATDEEWTFVKLLNRYVYLRQDKFSEEEPE